MMNLLPLTPMSSAMFRKRLQSTLQHICSVLHLLYNSVFCLWKGFKLLGASSMWLKLSGMINSLDEFVGFAGSDLGLDVFATFEHSFPADDVGNTLGEGVHELGLRLSETVSVGDIPGATSGGGVDTSATTGLELHLGADFLEIGAGGHKRDLDHSSGTESSSKVGGAGEDVSKMVVVHEVESCGLKGVSNDIGGLGESLEDVDDVVTLLHGDDTHVVLFVDPDEEVLGLVVEDTTGIGPVATASGGEKEGGVGLLEKVSVGAEGFFVSL